MRDVGLQERQRRERQASAKRVGEKIRLARLQTRPRLTHDDIAAAVGTTRQHLIKLENGQHLPGDDMIAGIAKATGKPVKFFADDEGEEEPSLDEALRKVLRRMIRDEVVA